MDNHGVRYPWDARATHRALDTINQNQRYKLHFFPVDGTRLVHRWKAERDLCLELLADELWMRAAQRAGLVVLAGSAWKATDKWTSGTHNPVRSLLASLRDRLKRRDGENYFEKNGADRKWKSPADVPRNMKVFLKVYPYYFLLLDLVRGDTADAELPPPRAATVEPQAKRRKKSTRTLRAPSSSDGSEPSNMDIDSGHEDVAEEVHTVVDSSPPPVSSSRRQSSRDSARVKTEPRSSPPPQPASYRVHRRRAVEPSSSPAPAAPPPRAESTGTQKQRDLEIKVERSASPPHALPLAPRAPRPSLARPYLKCEPMATAQAPHSKDRHSFSKVETSHTPPMTRSSASVVDDQLPARGGKRPRSPSISSSDSSATSDSSDSSDASDSDNASIPLSWANERSQRNLPAPLRRPTSRDPPLVRGPPESNPAAIHQVTGTPVLDGHIMPSRSQSQPRRQAHTPAPQSSQVKNLQVLVTPTASPATQAPTSGQPAKRSTVAPVILKPFTATQSITGITTSTKWLVRAEPSLRKALAKAKKRKNPILRLEAYLAAYDDLLDPQGAKGRVWSAPALRAVCTSRFLDGCRVHCSLQDDTTRRLLLLCESVGMQQLTTDQFHHQAGTDGNRLICLVSSPDDGTAWMRRKVQDDDGSNLYWAMTPLSFMASVEKCFLYNLNKMYKHLIKDGPP